MCVSSSVSGWMTRVLSSTMPLETSWLFFLKATTTTEIYTLSLHDALPICARGRRLAAGPEHQAQPACGARFLRGPSRDRSEEHTSELQSRGHLVCRLLLEKKNLAHPH